VWILALVIWLSFAGYGFWIATIKRRQPAEGILFGVLLGPIGCVVEACLRERTAEQIEAQRLRRCEEAQARLEEKQESLVVTQTEMARRQKDAKARGEMARARRAHAYARFCEWFDRTIVKFGWYKALPEVVQPMVVGLLISLPLVIVLVYVFKRWQP
jgi:hypothetical protein